TEVELTAFRKSADDRLTLSLSVDDGKTWKRCWAAPADKTGRQTFTVALDDKFKVVPRKWAVPDHFNSPFGRYAFRLKLELVAAGESGHCRVEAVAFRTSVQHAIRSLPQLSPGKNRITVRGALADDAAVKVTYVWKDLEGKDRKNVAVAEALPHTYEIRTVGRKWEDVVCKELLIEAIAATGAGSRTVVKEAPGPTYPLPPLPPAAETRTRWVRPLHRAKQKPSAEQVIAWLKQKRTVKRGLTWASELGAAEAFDAVHAVAFDRELCKAKGVKEHALIALYNTDRARARPLLLKVARDSACETGWKYDAENPAVAGGHWMSGACMVGQMAADAGWAEFAPALAEAMGSEYCGSRHRMSLLRSLCAIARPGDEAVTNAVRESLARSYPYMLAEAAQAAGVVRDKQSIPRLRELLDHSFMAVRRRAALALGMLGDTASAPKLRASLFRIRRPATLDHRKYGTELWSDENMRAAAAEALGLMRDADSLPALRRALAHEPVPWVRKRIRQALAAIEGL
ncbi:MAG: HEAT repeat domain-containing protein, partial [Planctomycetota bacterium]